jgi:hypothetical protein
LSTTQAMVALNELAELLGQRSITLQRLIAQRLMRPLSVVVIEELSHQMIQVPVTEDH